MGVKEEHLHSIPDTIEQFEMWLRTKPNGASVGRSRNGLKCPIATYLNETRSHHARTYDVAISSAKLTTNTGLSSWIKMPRWMSTFIDMTDLSQDYEEDVTKEQALLTLEAVKATMG